MVRSIASFSLVLLTCFGCTQPGSEVAWNGTADQQGQTHSSDATVASTPTQSANDVASDSTLGTNTQATSTGAADASQATRSVQKPVLTAASENPVKDALCVLQPVGESKVSGTIRFTQEGNQLRIAGTVEGLTPGKHGFHIHEFGDLSDRQTGKSAGGHFNPGGADHGHQTDSASERHAGDFGNIEANEDGVAKIDITDSVATMAGEHSIIGRGIVVHADEDKFTQPSGDAGARVAFGVIGVANPDSK